MDQFGHVMALRQSQISKPGFKPIIQVMTCLEVLVSVICSWWAKGCFLLGHKILWMLYLTLVHWMFLTASLHFSSVNNFQKQCVAQLVFFSFPFVLSYRAGCRGAPFQKALGVLGLIGRALAPTGKSLLSHSREWPMRAKPLTVHLVCFVPLLFLISLLAAGGAWIPAQHYIAGISRLCSEVPACPSPVRAKV